MENVRLIIKDTLPEDFKNHEKNHIVIKEIFYQIYILSINKNCDN